MTESAPESIGLFPLTPFDKLFERTTFVTGWLVEGTIDAGALATALARVTEKWRMLAGRLGSVKEEKDVVKWHIKIPLGPIPQNYATYALTTSTSPVPLSRYVSVPIPSVSNSIPPTVFLHASTPRHYAAWESANHPLTCWNIVHFPADENNGVAYTCIGFSRCHGIFDGGGASLVMNAVISELNGKEWTAPPSIHEGVNVNPVEVVLAREAQTSRKDYQDHASYTPIGPSDLVKLIAWHVRERYWRGADRRIILLPKVVLNHLVEDVRSTLRSEHKQVEHVTTGDILVAWIFKTVHASGTDAKTLVHCTNLASFRGLLPPEAKAASYAHNAFVPLPYPVLSVADLQSFSLSSLTNLFAASRASLSMDHVVSAYKLVHKPCFPNPPDANETMTVSNVSASRILESDWSAIGSKKTLCGYRYQATPTDVMFANAVYIAGRLDDGSVVLDVTLNKTRLELLTGEIQRTSARLARLENYAKRRP